MSDRYKIIKGSQTAHCCFEYSIVDTEKPVMFKRTDGTVYHYNDEYEVICECFEYCDAVLIAARLNT